MTPAPKRRWFRFAFSLRTLFAVVTVIACWLGYEFNWIHKRHQWIADQFAFLEPQTYNPTAVRYVFAHGWPVHYKPAPGILGWFGERGLIRVLLYLPKDQIRWNETSTLYFVSASNNKLQETKALFPEAEIDVYWYDRDGRDNERTHKVQVQ